MIRRRECSGFLSIMSACEAAGEWLRKNAMFDRSLLIDALVHDDFFVRSRVLDQFAEDRDPDPMISRQYMKGVKRYGWVDAYEWENRVSALTFDDDSFAWLVESIRDQSEHGPSDRQRHFLLEAFSNGPIDFIERYLDEVSSVPVDPGVFGPARELMGQSPVPSPLDLAAFRLSLSAESIDGCKALFEELLDECEYGEGFPHGLLEEMKCVSKRLAEEGALIPPRVLDCIATGFDEESPREHWRAGHALYEAGLLRLEEAAPSIVELFEVDWDWINEEIPKALIAIGTESVLDAVIKYYPHGTWTERLYLCNVLEKLRFTGKEARLVKLLDEEKEEDLRKDIAVALARYGSPSARERALEVYLENPDDPDQFEIAEDLYPVMVLDGENEPLLTKWRMHMESLQARSGEMDEHILAIAKEFAAREERDSTLPLKASTKVGRNAPCPCGSGKKYKKCCLNS